MITLPHVFVLVGAVFAAAAILNARDRRWAVAGFWAILVAPCWFRDPILAASKAGTQWPAQLMGAGVLALAVLAALIKFRPPSDEGAAEREAAAQRFGDRLFGPVLAIPGLVAALVLAARIPGSPIPRLLDPPQLALVSFGVAVAIALVFALAVTRDRPLAAATEGRRLLDTMGSPAVLPVMLATLGVVFADTGVGKAIAALVQMVIPTDNAIACLIAFGLGMVAFTMIMGNAFAAFPVMMSGIGLPLLVKIHGAHPAALGAMGMLTGYCGTLLTPMAANYNIVPVLLLELRDSNAVIRAQWPTAVALLTVNLILMSQLVF